MQAELKDIASMTRREMIDALMWSEGGTGWGACSFANQMMARLSRQELPSIATIQGHPAYL